MVFERQQARYPDVRPVILMRSGFAGSQRYGMIPWTGDVNRSWGGLKPQVELSLSMSLLGLAYTHSDLGGFAGGETFDRELYLRWLLYGVFQPVYRPHAQEHIAPEPVFHDRETLALAREFIRLRYRLLPYLYTLAFENATTGMPLMRPVFFEDETQLELIDRSDAYLWGDAFFVHPVTDPGLESIDVHLPDGTWFDFWTDERYEGGTASIPVTLATIPVLVRAGAFVPMVDPVMSTDEYSSAALTLHYYADDSAVRSSGRMYEDDGESKQALESGAYEMLDWSAERSGDELAIDFSRSGGTYPGQPATRDMTVEIHNWRSEIRSIDIDGKPIKLTRRLPKRGAAAVAGDEAVTIRFRWNHSDSRLRINGVTQ
jgi:oligosaccharide 4-alpha-D-glucosyltransferase